jgi:hypothetical protein
VPILTDIPNTAVYTSPPPPILAAIRQSRAMEAAISSAVGSGRHPELRDAERMLDTLRSAMVMAEERRTPTRIVLREHPELPDLPLAPADTLAAALETRFRTAELRDANVLVDDQSAALCRIPPVEQAQLQARAFAADSGHVLVDDTPASTRHRPDLQATQYRFYTMATADAALTVKNAMVDLRMATTAATEVITVFGESVSKQILAGVNTYINGIYLGGTVGTNATTGIDYGYMAQSTAGTNANFGGWVYGTGDYQRNTFNPYFTTHWEHLPDTPEQAAAKAARAAKLEVVSQKAEQLLLSHLTEPQRRSWLEHKFIDVRSETGKRYRLKPGHGHVYLLGDGDMELRRYCANGSDPGGALPDCDNIFVQMMTLKFDERAFLRVANTWRVDGVLHGAAGVLQPEGIRETVDRWTFVGQGADAEALVVQ